MRTSNELDTNQQESVADRLYVHKKEIAAQVRRAFSVRPLVGLDATQSAPVLQVDQAIEKREQELDQSPDEMIVIPEFRPQPHEVVIDDPRLYPYLLELASKEINLLRVESSWQFVQKGLELMNQFLQFATRFPRNKMIDEVTDHEYAHAVPALGEKDVRIKYGVGFYHTSTGPRFQPFIAVEGKVSRALLSKIRSAPKTLSVLDKVLTGMA